MTDEQYKFLVDQMLEITAAVRSVEADIRHAKYKLDNLESLVVNYVKETKDDYLKIHNKIKSMEEKVSEHGILRRAYLSEVE